MPQFRRMKKAEKKAAKQAAQQARREKAAATLTAHIVFPASKLAAAKRGEAVESLCGDATIKGDAKPGAAICQKCVIAQFEADDVNATERATVRYNEGLTTGEQRGELKGRDDTMREILEGAEKRARELEQASK